MQQADWKESHNLFLIVQENSNTIKTYMRRFKMDKMEILQFLNSIAIKAFHMGTKWDTSLFIELTKIIPWSLDIVYEEAKKFINVERKLKPTKGSSNWTMEKSIPTKKE